jgi:hypothetical protein
MLSGNGLSKSAWSEHELALLLDGVDFTRIRRRSLRLVEAPCALTMHSYSPCALGLGRAASGDYHANRERKIQRVHLYCRYFKYVDGGSTSKSKLCKILRECLPQYRVSH